MFTLLCCCVAAVGGGGGGGNVGNHGSLVAEFFRGLELHSRGCKEEVFGYALAGPEAD